MYDEATAETAGKIRQINDELEQHLQDARQVWNQRAQSRISEEAFRNAVEAARVEGLVEGGVGFVHVAKDITVEEFEGRASGLTYF